MTAQSISGLGAAEPELCRVSVIGGNTQLDVGLPANAPIAAFIGDLVQLIESRNPDPTGGEEGEHRCSRSIGRWPNSVAT